MCAVPAISKTRGGFLKSIQVNELEEGKEIAKKGWKRPSQNSE